LPAHVPREAAIPDPSESESFRSERLDALGLRLSRLFAGA
jgi:hypothetical protein